MEDRLRKFARVAETGSFTLAAKELHTSQPALSSAVSKLERELGNELLSRRKPPVKLTDAGQTAYRYAKKIDVTADNLKTELAELTSKKPSLKIGMIDSVADALFVHSHYLPELREQADISLAVDNSRLLIRSVEKRYLDIALITKPRQLQPTLASAPLGREPLVAITSPKNAAKVKKSIKNSGKINDFLSYDRSSNTDRLIRSHFASKGIDLQTIFSSTSPEILLHLVLSGEGVAVLPYLMVKDGLEQNKLIKVAGPVMRPIIAIEPKGKITPDTLKSLKDRVKLVNERLLAEVGNQQLQASVRSTADIRAGK